MFQPANAFVVTSYLKYIDREINDHIDKVSEGKAGYQCVGAIPHALVLVNDPQQGGIPHHSHDENSTRYHSVNVFESWSNLSLLWAIVVHWAIVGEGQIRGSMCGNHKAEFCPTKSGEIVHMGAEICAVALRIITDDTSNQRQPKQHPEAKGFHLDANLRKGLLFFGFDTLFFFFFLPEKRKEKK